MNLDRIGYQLFALLTIAVALSACSSDEESNDGPSTTGETETADTADDVEPPADLPEGAVNVAGGLMTLTLSDGWQLEADPLADVSNTFDSVGAAFAVDLDEIQDLVQFTNGHIRVFIAREPRFLTAPAYQIWRRSLIDAWQERGLSISIEAPFDWAGSEGDTLIGSTGGNGFFRIDTVAVDGMYFAMTAFAESNSTSDEIEELNGILQTVEVDRSALTPLAHAVDVRTLVSSQVTGGSDFVASFLAPIDWLDVSADEGGPIFGTADGESFIQIVALLHEFDFEAEIEAELDSSGREFLGVELVRTESLVDNLPVVVLWSGEPGGADAAIVFASDGSVVAITYITTRDDPALLNAMIESSFFPRSALAG